jgi:hypothetical protein
MTAASAPSVALEVVNSTARRLSPPRLPLSSRPLGLPRLRRSIDLLRRGECRDLGILDRSRRGRAGRGTRQRRGTGTRIPAATLHLRSTCSLPRGSATRGSLADKAGTWPQATCPETAWLVNSRQGVRFAVHFRSEYPSWRRWPSPSSWSRGRRSHEEGRRREDGQAQRQLAHGGWFPAVYRKEIVPGLSRVSLSQLVEATGLSAPYCS